MRQDFLIGQDVRGQNLYMTDFQKDFGVLRRCKKLTAEGRKLKKISKYYKNHEIRTPDFYNKLQEDRKIEE